MHTQKPLSILLTLCMIVGLLPAAAIPARANAPTGPVGISLDVSAVETGDTVWFGKNNDDPIAWRVLSPKGDTTNAVSGSDDVLVISKYLQEETTFADSGNVWENSRAQAWCRGYGNGWPVAEKAAIKETSVSESANYTTKEVLDENDDYDHGGDTYGPASLEGEHFFFLSAEEADTYFADDADRMAYAPEVNETSNNASSWWLRSPQDGGSDAGRVGRLGAVNASSVSNGNICVRPAFNLNPNAVRFISAIGFKEETATAGTLREIGAYNGNGWKLTLPDSSRDSFAVTETTATTVPGGAVTLHYTGATTGDHEYVSALLYDAAGTKLLHYGSGAALTSAGGTVSFTLPADLAPGMYTLKVFNEQKNGNNLSDYASAFKTVTLTVNAGNLVKVIRGEGMTRSAASGAASQGVTSGSSITPVVYTANEGYYFPENYTSLGTTTGVTVTREVDIVMMYNYAQAKGYDTKARVSLDQFSDAASVSPAAKEAMEWAVAMGLINGIRNPDGSVTLNAQGIASRAQVSAIAQRFCENVVK